MPGEGQKLTANQRIERAKAANVPRIYLNGFQVGLTSADVIIAGESNSEPAVMINMSFTLAKTLAKALTNTIATMEEKVDRSMLTTHEFEALMKDLKDGDG